MQAVKVLLRANRLVSSLMGESKLQARLAAAVEPMTLDRGGAGLTAVLGMVTGLCAILLALIASRSSTPLLLTLMASLAMLGVFFILGVAAGYVRIGETEALEDITASVADAVSHGILVTESDGSIAYSNSAVAPLLGLDGAIGSLEAALSREPKAAEALFRMLRAVERGQSHAEEISLPAKGAVSEAETAARRVLRLSVRPFGKADKPADRRALWQITDITDDRSRETSALDELRAQLSYYDMASVGVIAAGADNAILHANATVARWLGLATPAIADKGARLTDILSADAIQLLWAQARKDEVSAPSIDLDVRRADGRLMPVRFGARREIRDGVPCLVLVVLDRSSDTNSAQDPAAAEVRLARLFQSAPFGIATIAADGRIATTNAAFARMIVDNSGGLNETAADVLARNADTDTRVAIENALAAALAGQGNIAPMEITLGAKGEYARRVYMSPFVNGPRPARGRHPLCGRRDRGKGGAQPVRPEPEDGSRRQARRRHRARLQQHADGHPRLLRHAAAPCIGRRMSPTKTS